MPGWHPVVALVEDAPGFWRMVAQYDRTYGTIRLVRRGGELGYRAESIEKAASESELVGYFRTLRAAAEAVHQVELSRVGVSGAPNKPTHPSKIL